MRQYLTEEWKAELTQTIGSRQWAIWRDGVRVALVDHRPMSKINEEEEIARMIAAVPALIKTLHNIVGSEAYRKMSRAQQVEICRVLDATGLPV